MDGKTAKHTPGPWEVEDPMGAEIGLSIVQADLKTYEWEFIAMVHRSEAGEERVGRQRLISAKEQEANAHLIAAAPDMLTALKEIAAWAEQANPAGYGGLRETLFRKVDAAISKAEGRS